MKQDLIALGTCTLLALLPACGSNSEAAADDKPGAKAGDPESQKETMQLAVAELMAGPEQDVERVEVQHVLIAFAGASRATTTRLRPDAETLAAQVFCRLVEGEDIDALMKEFSDDPGPGIYIMNSAGGSPGEFARAQMAQGFGDVSWRLEVGEIGVAPFDPKTSPFGWHIIKRLN